MSTLHFRTPGTLDEAFIFTMGASVKQTDNPIGFFGTGLKYAIAITMRLGGAVQIMTKNHSYYFQTKEEEIRGAKITMIYCDKRDLRTDKLETIRCPMTTDYGRTWEPWMALRELVSNTKDENGTISEELTPVFGSEETIISVNCPQIFDAWLNRNAYFIDERRTPAYEDDEIQIYYGQSNSLFYKGIRVTKSPVNAALTYNFKSGMSLTEDRTLDTYAAGHTILHRLAECKSNDVCTTVVEASRDPNSLESRLPYTSWSGELEISPRFIDAALEAYIRNPETLAPNLRQVVVNYRLKNNAEEVYAPCQLTDVEQTRFAECIALLRSKGMHFDDYKVTFTESMPALQFGLALSSTKHIVVNINNTLRDQVLWKMHTCTTLIEEWVHLTYNVPDCSRDMQERYNEMIYKLMTREQIT
jgi:hypothetical protein